MSGTPAPLRRTPLAIALARPHRRHPRARRTERLGPDPDPPVQPKLTANTSCVAPGSVNRFTATITNSSTSNQALGSALFHSNTANGFSNIAFRSFTRPVASGGKTWQALPDLVHGAGVYLRAASPRRPLHPASP